MPLTTQLIDTYMSTKLDASNYPGLIQPNSSVETVAVGALLVTLATPADSARARRVNHLVDHLFARFDQLQQPTHHPKWQEASLSVQVAGWTRYPEATAPAVLIDQGKPDQGKAEQPTGTTGLDVGFDAYSHQVSQTAGSHSDVQRGALYGDFLRWRERTADRRAAARS